GMEHATRSVRPSSCTSMLRRRCGRTWLVAASSERREWETREMEKSVQPNAYKYALTTRERPGMPLGIERIVEQRGGISAESYRRYDKGSFAQHISEACNQQSNRARSLGPFFVMVTRSHRGIGWAPKRSIMACGLIERGRNDEAPLR